MSVFSLISFKTNVTPTKSKRITKHPVVEKQKTGENIYITHFQMNFAYINYSVFKYRNDPKFSDRYVWANSADPDQTVPRGAVWSGSTLFVILSAWLDSLLCDRATWFKF